MDDRSWTLDDKRCFLELMLLVGVEKKVERCKDASSKQKVKTGLEMHCPGRIWTSSIDTLKRL
jgi:hypothetical protein